MTTPPNTLEEGDAIDITTECEIATVDGSGGNAWVIGFMCKEDEGSTQFDQSYTLDINHPSALPSHIVPSSEVSLRYFSWNGIDVGAGTRMSISAEGGDVLALYHEHADGAIRLCAAPDGSYLTAANAWLEPLGAQLEPAGCEDGSLLRLSRTSGTTTYHAYPGEIVSMGGITTLVGDASCLVRDHGGGDAWNLSVALWTP